MAPLASLRTGQDGDFVERSAGDLLDDELCDAVPSPYRDRRRRIGVDEVHQDLPAVAGIDGTGRVEHRDAGPGGQARPRVHERRPTVGQRQRHPGGDQGTLTGLEDDIRSGDQVRARVTGVGVAGQGQLRVEPAHQDVDAGALTCGFGHAGHVTRPRQRTTAPRATSPGCDTGRVGTSPSGVLYAERLHAPAWVWVVVMALVVSLAVAYGAAVGVGVGLVTAVLGGVAAGWGLYRAGARVIVTGQELIAGPALIPLPAVGTVRPLDAERTRHLRGPGADPRAYLLVRGWVSTSVYVEVVDPADPTPYWLVATRRPDQLAAALTAARAPT